MSSIYFRTRGGPVQGWGNIYRLCSFARYCRDQGNKDIMFFAEGPSSVQEFIGNQGFCVIELKEDISLSEEIEIFKNFPKADYLIIEMLECYRERQESLRKFASKIIVFDDLLDRTYSADLIVGGQELPNNANSEISDPCCSWLVGYEYFMMRQEFQPYLSKTRIYKTHIEKVLVTLGGGYYDVGYLKIAKTFSSMIEDIEVTFVLGDSINSDLNTKLKSYIPDSIILGNVSNLDQLFWDTDLAIVSGGYSKLEAAITGTPAIIMAAQWHQIPLAKCFSDITGMPYVGYMSYVPEETLRNMLIKLFPQESRMNFADNAKLHIDGHGTNRVYDAIMNLKTSNLSNVSIP